MKNSTRGMKIMIVAAHPDDEILGCAGTVARLVREGAKAYTLILGEGVTSRDNVRDVKGKLGALKKQSIRANKLIGVKEIFHLCFPDNKFDTVPLLDIVKSVEEVKNKIKPDLIFTHYGKDLNIDHRLSFEAVITAARPLPGETSSGIYSFEVPSSTDWNYPLTFLPDTFFNIRRTIEIKLEALEEYKNELRSFPHPRSIEGMKVNARYWGMKTGLEYAEAFKAIRIIK